MLVCRPATQYKNLKHFKSFDLLEFSSHNLSSISLSTMLAAILQQLFIVIKLK